MNLRVLRGPKKVAATFGVLLINDKFECFTLENSVKIIPAGTYNAKLYESPRFHRTVILLEGVPGRTFIEFHIANYPVELDGCIAVGRDRDQKQLYESKRAFDHLMQKRIGLANEITVTIEDCPVYQDEVQG